MSDSTEYSSLFALVDSHLSKTSISSSHDSQSPFNLPSLRNSLNNSSNGDIKSSLERRLPVSPFNAGVSESPIKNILAQQVANMLKTKEQKQQEDREQKLIEDMKQFKVVDDCDYVIDLMKAVQTPYNYQKQVSQDEVLSSSSSFESLFELKLTVSVEETKTSHISELLPLPCTSDLTYILNQNSCEGQPSTFGKVLTTRLRPVAAPYLHAKIDSTIKVFDFLTPSPCDIHKQKLRKPTMSSTYTSIIDI